MAPTVKLAEYLFARLRQLGIGSIHGVPGDFNLTLLDYVEPSGLHWVGNANELNAGYAADGYARIKGIGAIITTFGVGELSAINAIAGAYAERAPVVHIVGTPARPSQDGRLRLHHTFNDGEYRRFAQMHAHVTVAQTNLRDCRTAPDQIDDILKQCLLHSRPVYIEVPVDLVTAPVPAERLSSGLLLPDPEPTPAQETILNQLLDKIHDAQRPIILVDGETRAMGIVDEVQKLVRQTSWPAWTTSFGKGLLDETWPNVHSIYRGKFDDPVVQSYVANSDLILNIGPHHSSTNSFAFSSIPPAATTVSFSDTTLTIFDQVYRDIPAKRALSHILQHIKVPLVHQHLDAHAPFPRPSPFSFADIPAKDEPINHDSLWRLLAHNFLRPGDIVLGETGTAGYGVRSMPLPPRARFFAPCTWLSIGYMLPAAQGAALAAREQHMHASTKGKGPGAEEEEAPPPRTLLFVGDGSFQMTAQELSTVIREGLDVVVFVLNNDGYTIERCIHGWDQGYNDVGRWRYLRAPGFFGADEGVFTAEVRTWTKLEGVLGDERLSGGKGLRMVELVMGREDAPKGPLRDYLEKQKGRVE